MAPALPRLADLMALALTIAKEEPRNRLSAAVKNAARAESCVADVALAQNALEALAQLQGIEIVVPPLNRLALEHSLVANAIILYARATAVGAKAGERGHVPIRERLDAPEQTDHDTIIEIRHLALAHVRANAPIADQLWHREVVFAVENKDGSWLPAAMTRRVQVEASIVQALRRLLPKAETLLKDTYHRRLGYVTRALQARPDLAALLEEHLIDAVDLFGSEDEARRALTGRRTGRSAGIINH